MAGVTRELIIEGSLILAMDDIDKELAALLADFISRAWDSSARPEIKPDRLYQFSFSVIEHDLDTPLDGF